MMNQFSKKTNSNCIENIFHPVESVDQPNNHRYISGYSLQNSNNMPSNLITNPLHINFQSTNNVLENANCENYTMTLMGKDNDIKSEIQSSPIKNPHHDNNDQSLIRPSPTSMNNRGGAPSTQYHHYPYPVSHPSLAVTTLPASTEVDSNIYSMYHNISNLLHSNNEFYGVDGNVYNSVPITSASMASMCQVNNNYTGSNACGSLPDCDKINIQASTDLLNGTPTTQSNALKRPDQQTNFGFLSSQMYDSLSKAPTNILPSQIYSFNGDQHDPPIAEKGKNCMYVPTSMPTTAYLNNPNQQMSYNRAIDWSIEMNDKNNCHYMMPSSMDCRSLKCENLQNLSIEHPPYYPVAKTPVIYGNGVSNYEFALPPMQQPFSGSHPSNPIMFGDVSHFKVSTAVNQTSFIPDSIAANHTPNNDGDNNHLNGSNKNTQEGTKTAKRRLQRWYESKYQKPLAIDEVNRLTAPSLLEVFFNEIRDTRPGKVGKPYEQVTLTTYKNGLRRYFLSRPCPPAVDNFDIASSEFESINLTINNKQNLQKPSNKITKWSLIDSIDNLTILKLCDGGIVGTRNPLQLVRIVWLINTKCFSIKGRLAHHKVQISDFQMLTNSNGTLSIKYAPLSENFDLCSQYRDSPTNNSNSSLKLRKNRPPAILSPTDSANAFLISCFKLYFEKRPPGFQPFYLTPKSSVFNGEVWFNKVAMGKNSIGRIMNDILARKIAK